MKAKSNSYGVRLFMDQRGNTVCLLSEKLENWIVARCKESAIDLTAFGLPADADALHSVINNRLSVFEKLLDALFEKKNPGILHLKSILS